jgi:hypothetical protein
MVHLMPRDDWRKARDQSIARQAKREFASEGHSSFPYVWGDDPCPEFHDRPVLELPGQKYTGPTKAVWCVYDNEGVAVSNFDHRDRAFADAAAAVLTQQTGALHFVALRKVPLAPVPAEAGAVTSTDLVESIVPVVDPASCDAPSSSSEPHSRSGGRNFWYRWIWQIFVRIRRLF